MFGEEKNLKDTTSSPSPLQGEGSGEVSLSQIGGLSYTKTNKLITALYMVTDLIDKDEPIRNKLRTLGAGIISDIHLIQQNKAGYSMSFMQNKISELMSFLDIASAVNIISEMNFNILRKEFSELNQSILSAQVEKEALNKRIDLTDFFADSNEEELNPHPTSPLIRGRSKEGVYPNFGREISKGHTSIGVQKGSTLMKALSRVKLVSHSTHGSNLKTTDHNVDVFDVLKKQRRDSIINIIKTIGGGFD